MTLPPSSPFTRSVAPPSRNSPTPPHSQLVVGIIATSARTASSSALLMARVPLSPRIALMAPPSRNSQTPPHYPLGKDSVQPSAQTPPCSPSAMLRLLSSPSTT